MDELVGAIFRGVFYVVATLVYWRVLLCIAVALCIVYLMLWLPTGMNGFQAMVFVLISWWFGLAWTEVAFAPESSAVPPVPPVPEQTALWIAALGGVFMGYVWGALSSLTLASAVFGAVVLAVVCRVVYDWRSRAHGVAIPKKYTAVCVSITWIGYLVPLFQYGKFF